ncbi:MAG: hypothetical protein H0X40_15575 [Chthoniobacterales bacterium]|nr:hypothetical protein [Chthoniobacterales bacterium]
MRVALLAILVLFSGVTARSSEDAAATPQKMRIDFTSEDNATFTLNGPKVTALTVQLAEATYVVPAEDCAKLHDVHYGTVRCFGKSPRRELPMQSMRRFTSPWAPTATAHLVTYRVSTST